MAQPAYSPNTSVLGYLYSEWMKTTNRQKKGTSLVQYIRDLDLPNQTAKRLMKNFPQSIRADAAYNYDVGVLSEVITRGEISVR